MSSIEDYKLSDFVKVYDNMLSKETCRDVIQLFNNEAYPLERTEHHKKSPMFTQMMMTDVLGESHPLHQRCMFAFNRVLDNYKKDVPYAKDIPGYPGSHNWRMESFRIKHYQTNSEDQFTTHTDHHPEPKRQLAMFFYLNETQEGGETWFPCVGNIKTKMGRVVVFPPNWMYPHAGLKTTGDSDKFLLSTYLHVPVVRNNNFYYDGKEGRIKNS
tara:strand:- start:97 stop:738 length:642 start_codon:yes stop_codon:yes gene_type:complete